MNYWDGKSSARKVSQKINSSDSLYIFYSQESLRCYQKKVGEKKMKTGQF